MVKFWWSANAAGPTSFVDTSWAEKLTCDFTTSEVGDYLIIVSADLMMNDTTNEVTARVQLDDATALAYFNGKTNAAYEPFSTFYLAESLAVGAHYVDIDMYVNAGTGYYKNMHITVLRLDDVLPVTGMYDYASTESSTELTSSWATYATLTFTPDQAGDYLILGHLRLTLASTSVSCEYRLNYDSGSEYLPIYSSSPDGYGKKEAKVAADAINVFWGGIVSLPASEKTILLEARDPFEFSDIWYRRIIAIRLSALNSESNEDASSTNTNSVAWYDKLSLSFTPNSTGNYLLLGSQFNGMSAVGRYSFNRFVQTAGTGTGTIQENEWQTKDITDNHPTSSCYIKSLAGSTLQTFKLQHHDQNGTQYNYSKGAFIAAIRLEDRWWNASLASVSFTNTSYQEKHTLEFNTPASGDYLILVSGTMRNTVSTTSSVSARVQLDDTYTIVEQMVEHNSAALEYVPFSGFYLAESLSAGAHYVDLDAFSEAGDTCYVYEYSVAIIRIDDWLPTTGMYKYNAVETLSDLTYSWATYATITFTPDQAGDYLVFATCAINDAAFYSDYARINYDSGSKYVPILGEGSDVHWCKEPKDLTDIYQQYWAGVVTIPASSKTIVLEAKTQDGWGEGQIQRRRIFAIRLAAMDSSYESDIDEASSNTSSSSWQDKSVLTFTPSSASEYLLLAGLFTEADSSTAYIQQQINQTAGTGSGVLQTPVYYQKDQRDSLPTSFPLIKYLGAISQTFKTQWRGDGTYPTYCRNSYYIAIRKPTAEVEAFKDIPLKVSIESALTYKDVPLKLSIDIGPAFKDVLLKTSIESEFIFKDIPLKISISSAGFTITGITYDKSGNPLGNCKCYLFKDNLDNTLSFIAFTTSNPSTGVYSFIDIADDDAQYLVVAWKDDSPHVFDVTDHVLQPS